MSNWLSVSQCPARWGWFPLDFVQDGAQAIQLPALLFPVVFSLVGLIPFLPFVTAGNVLLFHLTGAKAMAVAMFC